MIYHPLMEKTFKRRRSSSKRTISTEMGLQAVEPLLEQAEAAGIKYALCGGIAMHLYGFSRATQDVDVIASKVLDLASQRHISFGGESYEVEVGGQRIKVDWIVRDDFFQDFYGAALEEAEESEDGYPIITPEWMIVLKYIAKRSKDRLDMMWLLQQPGLVDRERVLKIFEQMLGTRAALFPIREMEEMFAQADIAALRDTGE
jgi:hypothetical protein